MKQTGCYAIGTQYILEMEKTIGEGNTLLAIHAHLTENKGLSIIPKYKASYWISALMTHIQSSFLIGIKTKLLKTSMKTDNSIKTQEMDIRHTDIRHCDGYQNC